MTQPHCRPAKRLAATQIADSLERSQRVHDVASLGVSLCRGHVPKANVSDGRTHDSPLSLRLLPWPPTWEADTTTCPRRRTSAPTGIVWRDSRVRRFSTRRLAIGGRGWNAQKCRFWIGGRWAGARHGGG